MASVANDSSDDTSSTTSDSTEGTSDVDMASVITDEDRTAAEAFKVIGNEHFTTSRYPQAAEAYTAAIEKNPQSAVYFSNRAATFLKMEQFGLAMRDAKQGIALDSKYVKAYYRLASSYMSLGKFKPALKIFQRVCKIKPKSKDAKKKCKVCKDEVTKAIFEAAVRTERGAPLSETIDLNSMIVPDSYEGPRLEQKEEITEDFVRALIEWQRGQKSLHRKYMVVILLRMLEYMRNQPSLIQIQFGARSEGASDEQKEEANLASGMCEFFFFFFGLFSFTRYQVPGTSLQIMYYFFVLFF